MSEGESHRERPSNPGKPPFNSERLPHRGQPPSFDAGNASRKVGSEGFEQWLSEWKEEERTSWEKLGERLKENPRAFLREFKAERPGWRQGAEHTEFSPREKQFIAMGEIGAKLTELRVDGEDRKNIFERLAKNPELTGEIADILKTIPPGDKALVEEYMKTAGDEMKRLTEQLKNNPEEAFTKLKWWELVLLVLAGILSVPAAAAAESLKPQKQEG